MCFHFRFPYFRTWKWYTAYPSFPTDAIYLRRPLDPLYYLSRSPEAPDSPTIPTAYPWNEGTATVAELVEVWEGQEAGIKQLMFALGLTAAALPISRLKSPMIHVMDGHN